MAMSSFFPGGVAACDSASVLAKRGPSPAAACFSCVPCCCLSCSKPLHSPSLQMSDPTQNSSPLGFVQQAVPCDTQMLPSALSELAVKAKGPS